jgi:hypothetical protein
VPIPFNVQAADAAPDRTRSAEAVETALQVDLPAVAASSEATDQVCSDEFHTTLKTRFTSLFSLPQTRI